MMKVGSTNADDTHYFGGAVIFCSNEGSEPIHVHARKGDMECKYWLNRSQFDLDEDFSNICLQGTKERSEKSFTITLNISKSNGTSYNGGVSHDEIS
jgi:hypothetical protein